MLEGTKAIPIPSRYCDLRDVARAHILAAEVPGAHGRYLVSHVDTVPSKFVSDALQVLFPTWAYKTLRRDVLPMICVSSVAAA